MDRVVIDRSSARFDGGVSHFDLAGDAGGDWAGAAFQKNLSHANACCGVLAGGPRPWVGPRRIHTLAVILRLLWCLVVGRSSTAGGLLHILLFVVLIAVLCPLLSARSAC